MPLELARISSVQLLSLPRTQTVFFFPVGPLEDHGPHLPLGADLIEAKRLCELAARKLEAEMPGWQAVLMPGAPLGIDSDTTAHALTVRGHVLRDWLVDSARSLIRSGFCHFVVFSGHAGPRQLTAIEEAGRIIYKQSAWLRRFRRGSAPVVPYPTLVSASSAAVPKAEIARSPLWTDPAEHGGRRDTSVLLAVAPAQVEGAYSALPAQQRDPHHWTRRWQHWRREVQGYWGKPAEATAEHGQKVLTGTVDEIFPKLRAVLEGANPEYLFRSWYSVLPPNKSFFKAWILALSFTFLLLMWVFINVRQLISG
jgi:creatinine amidohydrolase